MKATVTSPDAIQSVEVVVKAKDGNSSLIEMKKDDKLCYTADIDAFIKDGVGEYNYYIEAISESGIKSRIDDVILLVTDIDSSFDINHIPVKQCNVGEDIVVRLSVNSANLLKKVKLYYSYINHYKDMESVDMINKNGEYLANIPKEYIIRIGIFYIISK